MKTQDTNFNPKMEIDNELAKAQQKYKGKFVEYAGGKYEVYGVTNLFGCLFVQIYDEPPSKHVDMVKLSCVKLINDNAVESSSEPLKEKQFLTETDAENWILEEKWREGYPVVAVKSRVQLMKMAYMAAASKANARISSLESELKALREERDKFAIGFFDFLHSTWNGYLIKPYKEYMIIKPNWMSYESAVKEIDKGNTHGFYTVEFLFEQFKQSKPIP